MTKIKESEFLFQYLNLYNQENIFNYAVNPVLFDGNSSGFLFTNNENLLANVMIENPSQSKNELILGKNDIRDKDKLIYKHSERFKGIKFQKRHISTNTTTLNYIADEWARFNSIFSNKLLTTRLSTSKFNVMFKRYWSEVKNMSDLSSGSATPKDRYIRSEINRDMTGDSHYLFSLDSSYKNNALLSILIDTTSNNQKYILFTDTTCSQGTFSNFPFYNFQSLFVYKGDDLNIDTYVNNFNNNKDNTGDILKNTFSNVNSVFNNQLIYLFTDFSNRAIYFLKNGHFQSSVSNLTYRHFNSQTIVKATWGLNETILNAKFLTTAIQNAENVSTGTNFNYSSLSSTLDAVGNISDSRYFSIYKGYMGKDFAGQNYFLFINEAVTRDSGTTPTTNIENTVFNLQTILKNSWTTSIIKENPVNSLTTNVKNINYNWTTLSYEIGNTNRNVIITSTTSVALTINKNNTFNLTTTNVIYYSPVSPLNNDIFRVQHLGSTGSFRVRVSATNSTELVPLTTSASAIKTYYFKYNSSNTTWELQTDLGYFPIPGTHLWNEPRTGLVSTYLPVPSKAIVDPNNSNIYYFYAPSYTNTNFTSSKVKADLSQFTPILYIWDKSLTSSDAITIYDTTITYPGINTWFTYGNTHTEGFNQGTGGSGGNAAQDSGEYYYNFETSSKLRESHDNTQLHKFFHHNFITKVGNRYFLNHCIFYGTNHNANILVDNSNNGLTLIQKSNCRRIIVYEINIANWRNLSYHSYYEFLDTQVGFLPLDENNFTKILINQTNSVSILSFDVTAGWTLNVNYPGNFLQISQDSNNNIWAVKCNINLQEKLYGNLLSDLVTKKVIFELHKLSDVDPNINVSNSYKIDLKEENEENIFYSSTIDDNVNSLIKNLKLSVYDNNNNRQSIIVNLQIQNGNGKILFNDNGLDYISVTTDTFADITIELLIQEARHFYIVSSLDIS